MHQSTLYNAEWSFLFQMQTEVAASAALLEFRTYSSEEGFRVMSWIGRLLTCSRRQPVSGPDRPGAEPSEWAASELLERGIAHYRDRSWAQAESLLTMAIGHPACSAHDREVGRNILGSLLERTSRPREAVAVYEANVAEHPQGSYSFERLARLYRKLDRPLEAQWVLARAIQSCTLPPRPSGPPRASAQAARLPQ
jgi:hypothetical protein